MRKTFGLAEQEGTLGFWRRLTAKRFASTDLNVLTAFREVWENAPLEGFGFGVRRVISWSRPEGVMLYTILIFAVVAGLGALVRTINRSFILF